MLGADAIARVTVTGQVTYFPRESLGSSNGDHIVAGRDGTLWFTGNGAELIHRMTRSGVITDFTAPGPGQVYGLAPGPDGAIWFTQLGQQSRMSNSIGRITFGWVRHRPSCSCRTAPHQPDQAPSDMPLEITAGPNGNLYFTTYLVEPKNYIGQVTPEGTVHAVSRSRRPARPRSASRRGPDGNIWFTENFNQLVGRLNRVLPPSPARRSLGEARKL